jgi:hypothetical protein
MVTWLTDVPQKDPDCCSRTRDRSLAGERRFEAFSSTCVSSSNYTSKLIQINETAGNGIRMERHTDISYLERDILGGIIREKQALILGEIKTLLSLHYFIAFGIPQASCPNCTTVSGCNYKY